MQTVETLPNHISFSQARMWLRCPRQHFYRYAMGLRLPPSGAMVVGTSAHKGIEHHMTVKAREQQDPPWDEVADVYSQTFNAEAPDALWDGEDPGDAKDRGYKALELFHRDQAPQITPAGVEFVERKLTVPLDADGLRVDMVLDLIDAQSNLLDFKTSGRKPNEVSVDTVAQLRLYQHGANLQGIPVTGLRAVYLITAKSPTTESFAVDKGSPSEVAGLVRMLRDVRRAMEQAYAEELFLPALLGSWWCQETTCGYWRRCHRDFG